MSDSYTRLLRSLRRWRDARAVAVGFAIGCALGSFLALTVPQ